MARFTPMNLIPKMVYGPGNRGLKVIPPLRTVPGISPYEQMVRTIISESAHATLGDVFGLAAGEARSARGKAARASLMRLSGLSAEAYSAVGSRAAVQKRLQEEAALAAMTKTEFAAYEAAQAEVEAVLREGISAPGEWFGEWKTFKDSQGRIQKVSRTELRDLETRMANSQEAELVKRQKRQWQDIEGTRKQMQGSYRAGLDKLVSNVSSMVTQNSVLSAPELRSIIGAALALLSEFELEAVIRSIREITREVSKLELYYIQSAALQQLPFTLFINDSNYVRSGEDMTRILSSVAFTTEKEVLAILYGAMDVAFREAWSGLTGKSTDPNTQFPNEYRVQIRKVIDSAFENERIRMLKGPKGTGQPWQIVVDFYDLFGDRADFQRAYHFRAMKKGGGQVFLPYGGTGEDLQNPTLVRYAYWRAIWEGKTWYTPAADATSRKEHAANMRERRNTIPEKLSKLRQERDALVAEDAKRMGESATLRNKSNEDWSSTGDIPGVLLQDTLANYNERIEKLEKQFLFANKYKSTQPRKMKDPIGAKQRTIAQRVAIFQGDPPKAPFWILLEYGQLRWEPKIPPKGVWSRYQKIVREQVSALFRNEANKQYGSKKGYTVQPDAAGKGTLVKSPYPAPGEVGVVINSYKNYGTNQDGAKSKLYRVTPIMGPTIPTTGASGWELNEEDYIKTIYKNVNGNISLAARDNAKAAAQARQATARIVSERVRGADKVLPRMPTPKASTQWSRTNQWSPETRAANPRTGGRNWWETTSTESPLGAAAERRGQAILREEIEARRRKLGLS